MLPENGNPTDLQSEFTDTLPLRDHAEESSEDVDAYNFWFLNCSLNDRTRNLAVSTTVVAISYCAMVYMWFIEFTTEGYMSCAFPTLML